MHSLLLEFHLRDQSVLTDLLHELNLHDDVDARAKEDTADSTGVVVLVALPAADHLVWTVRSVVSLFDPRSVEMAGGQGR